MNSIQEITNRLTSLCEQHQFIEAYTELFADDAVSIDPIYKNEPLTDLTNLVERERQFLAGAEIHEVKISLPVFAGNFFCETISMVFTVSGQDKRTVEELAVYKIANGKIVSQQFFIG